MNYLKQIPSEGYYQLPPPGYSYSPPQEEKEVNLRDYWKVIRKRQWIIIAFFLIVVITTAIGTFTMKPIYRGTTTIQINKENPQIVDFKEIFCRQYNGHGLLPDPVQNPRKPHPCETGHPIPQTLRTSRVSTKT